MDLQIFTTGGTIDKVYFDALSDFQVGDPALRTVLTDANVVLDYEITSLMKKDSLDLTDADRAAIADAVAKSGATAILITHGTDTMVETAKHIAPGDRTVVLTGAMQPAALRSTDAIFNTGFAVACTQLLPPGVHIAMNGRVLDPATARKDRAAGRFRRA